MLAGTWPPDGLYCAFTGTFGLPLSVEGGPLFGAWRVVFNGMRVDTMCPWMSLMFSISVLEIRWDVHSCLYRCHASFTARMMVGWRWSLTSCGISWGVYTWLERSPGNPRFPWVNVDPKMKGLSTCRPWWLYSSVDCSAWALAREKIKQVWLPCCHSIWQHICRGSPPLCSALSLYSHPLVPGSLSLFLFIHNQNQCHLNAFCSHFLNWGWFQAHPA